MLSARISASVAAGRFALRNYSVWSGAWKVGINSVLNNPVIRIVGEICQRVSGRLATFLLPVWTPGLLKYYFRQNEKKGTE